MGNGQAQEAEAFRQFVDQYRARCLWFLRSDYYPDTPDETATVLRLIERHGDRHALHQVALFRQWLSRHFSEISAGS